MVSLFKTAVGEKVSQLEANSDNSTPKTMVITNDNLYSVALNSTTIFSQTSRFTNAVNGSVTLSNYMTPWWRDDLFYAHGDAYFDNAHGSLLAMAIENSSVPAEILKEPSLVTP